MQYRNIAILACVALLIVSAIACAGKATAPDLALAPPAITESDGLPALPLQSFEPHQPGMVDGTVFDGDTCVAFNGGVLSSGMAMLESTAAPVAVGWALYQIPEPVDPPFSLTVKAAFVDPDPVSSDPRDGYWVAYGNYDKGTWVFNGPYTSYQVRLFFEPGMDVVSPGGDVTALVLCENGNQVNVETIQIGTDAGAGYDLTVLGRTAGGFVGEWADIETDAAGNPHIIYNVSPIMLYTSHMYSTLRYAYHDGAAWHVEEFDTPGIDSVRWAHLAIGDLGRRAVLVKTRDFTDDLYLYYDDGGGTFADLGVVAAGTVTHCMPGLGFINSADIVGGERDLLVFTYAIHTAAPDTQTYYRTCNAAGVLSAETNLYALQTLECGRIDFAVGPGHNGLAGVPQKGGPDWRYYVGHYSALADTWNFGAVVSYVTPELVEDGDDDRPDFCLRQITGGDIIASYLVADEEYIRFARWNGLDWVTSDQDMVPTYDGLSDYMTAIDVYSTGQAAAIVPFGSGSPMLTFGTVGAGVPWFRSYLSLEEWSMLQGSLTVDAADNTHVVTIDFDEGLQYYRRDAVTHELTSETVDNRGGTFGFCFGYSFPVWHDGRLHLFYADEANHCIRHSVNNSGVWDIEHERISTDELHVPYMVVGAGYLEDLDLLYAVYVDMMTFSAVAVTGPPDGSDWQTNEIAQVFMMAAAVADNESEIAILGPSFLMGGSMPMFAHGNPRDGLMEREVVTFADEQFGERNFLTYNSFNDQWCAVSTDADEMRVNYFLRAPAGNWVGPFTVVQEYPPAGEVEACGLAVNKATGDVRVTVKRRISGDTHNQIWVYTAPNGSAVFTPTQQLISVDTTTHDYQYSVTVNKGDGEPIVAVLYKLIADPDYDVRFFAPSAPDTWSSIGVWTTEFKGFYLSMALDDMGRIICTGIEMEGDPEMEGRVFVRYPW